MQKGLKCRWVLAAAVAAGALISPSAHAANRWWDATNGSGLTPGNGDWVDSNGAGGRRWANSATPGTAAPTRWNQNDTAFFDVNGGTSVVTVDPNGISVNGITFTGTGYTIGGTGVVTLVTSNSIAVNADAIFNAPIGGSIGMNKSGTAILTLGGSSTYTGTTTVSGGTLLLSSGGAIGSSNLITVNSGANFNVSAVSGGFNLASSQALAGRGTVHGNVTASGTSSKISPGGSGAFGKLTVASGNVAMSSNATLTLEIGGVGTGPGVPDTNYDQVALSGTSNTFTINGATLQILPLAGISTTGNYTIVSTNRSGGNGIQIGSGFFAGIVEGVEKVDGPMRYTVTRANNNNDIVVHFTMVPEPGSATGVLLLSATHLVRRRRRRAS